MKMLSTLSAIVLGAGLIMSFNAFAEESNCPKECATQAMYEKCQLETKGGTVAPTGPCEQCLSPACKHPHAPAE